MPPSIALPYAGTANPNLTIACQIEVEESVGEVPAVGVTLVAILVATDDEDAH